jgi:transposase InsO family protein
MAHLIHTQARTTPKVRGEIREGNLSERKTAELYNISRVTARKWKTREDVEDRSHRPHTLHTTLTPQQEAIVVSLRESLYLPLDDLLYIARKHINEKVSRSGLARCLKRYGMSRLSDVLPKEEGATEKPKKTFKDYVPGFIHIDIKYLPQMPDESSRSYLFVAIDRATRWVFIHVYADMTEKSSVDFLRRLKAACPVKITKILTDNGTQFTDRFTSKEKQPTGEHAFDVACKDIAAEHRLCKPRHPQTNGMVERFNGRISELLAQTRFANAVELCTTLQNYVTLYNHHIPQRALDAKTPAQALKIWQQKSPDLFTEVDIYQAGLDS